MEAFDLIWRPLPRPACRVRVGAGALDLLVDDLAHDPPGRRVVVVSDQRVAPLHGAPLVERLVARGLRAELLTVPAGEAGKTRETKAGVEDRLLELGAGRDTTLVGVGGGAVGDLTGFVAATWHRGVPVVQVPTSLLAMVDAALGGKTAVDLHGVKNLVGAFHQPLGVYADLRVLDTLSARDYTDGLAEAVKAAAIADADLFDRLERSHGPLRDRATAEVEQVVLRCMRIKADVVREDEREAGRRAVLNFGHTVAHAVEAASDHAVRHGPAVAMGMCVESRLACRQTGFPEGDADRLQRLLETLGLPVRVPRGIDPEAVVAAARSDKKNREGRIRCALPLRLGSMPEGDDVTVVVEAERLAGAVVAAREPASD